MQGNRCGFVLNVIECVFNISVQFYLYIKTNKEKAGVRDAFVRPLNNDRLAFGLYRPLLGLIPLNSGVCMKKYNTVVPKQWLDNRPGFYVKLNCRRLDVIFGTHVFFRTIHRYVALSLMKPGFCL